MNIIEKEIDSRIDSYLCNFFKEKFINTECKFFYDVSLNYSGTSENYFSEIEINFWDDNRLIDFYSILIYVKGEVQGSKEDIYNEAIYEINQILEKI